ncbi:nuclease-related domain-containing protein [Planomonospora sp. ID82291]|uniref:nuclease-related domain-containing protein n=1 Tax=Planomonospora sp. ID82291 TaxID=2738136 RepID=UPI0018C3E985|nr:nuclease-related domain-containing protein [Planomonospora sp. ID82291]MBG0819045.1 NERD domain-containing protein [Planomonospora sp. ID82291]
MALPRSRTVGAGASAHAQYRAKLAEGRRQRIIVRAVLAVVAAVVVGVLVSWLAGLVAAVLVAVVDTVYRWRNHEAVRTWRQGAKGERRTARMLRPLRRRGYTVLHDRALPTGQANVDHLIIGAAGVFVVDTKNWNRNKRITRRGRYVHVGKTWGDNAVKGVLYESRRVAEALGAAIGRPVDVTPVLAIHGPNVPLLRVMKVEGVPLLRASQVRHWITRGGARLSVEEVARLSAAAEQLFPPYTG